jgi:hypothetical protein
MLKEKKVGELGRLASCANCSAQGSTNVLPVTADQLENFEASVINFANYDSFIFIINVLERMEHAGLHLVGSDGKTVFKSSKMAEVVDVFRMMKEDGVTETGILRMLPLLTRTCNLRLQVYRIFVGDFDVEDRKTPNQKRSAILDLPMG